MTTGLFSSWKQPLGFFVSKPAKSGDRLKVLLEECSLLITNNVLCVKSVVCFQGTSNHKLLKLLNVNVDQPFFFHDERKV